MGIYWDITYIFSVIPILPENTAGTKKNLAIFSRGWKTPIVHGANFYRENHQREGSGGYTIRYPLVMTFTVFHGYYDGPNRNRWAIPFLIAWVDFPWQTVKKPEGI
jgi:hypothetical protein